jgi:TatD DNase family protein
MILIDSHAHLDADLNEDDLAGVLERARAEGLRAIVNIGGGDGLEYARYAISVAERHDDVFATVGLHPHDAKNNTADLMAEMRSMCAHPKVMAVGEVGLDFHYDNSHRETQRQVFREYIRLALDVDLPISLHIRDGAEVSAHQEAHQILKEEGADRVGGVVHCYTAGPDEVPAYLDLGFYLSIPGVVTFKKAEELRQAVALIPDDRIMVETDSPFLAPVPKRGRPNEPAYVRYIVEFLAELRGADVGRMALLTAENAVRMYRLPEDLLSLD